MTTSPPPAETPEEFRMRARAWLATNMPRVDPHDPPVSDRGMDSGWARARKLQKLLFDGGFAGICFPREYGGQGLPFEYQKVFDEETLRYEMPLFLNIPTLAICCATLLDMGSEQQKLEHISAALRGDEILAQLLSEPSGGSDLAGVVTRADRRGDKWVINGSKTWTTAAFAADYGLCLARTDWDVPKHQGLTMFLVPIHHPAITIRRIMQVNGSVEFCEEFFDDLEVGDDAVVGSVNKGWEVASRQMYHERRTMGNGSEFVSGKGSLGEQDTPVDYVALLEDTAQTHDIRARHDAGRAVVYRKVSEWLSEHVYRGVLDGALPPNAGSIIRLFAAEAHDVEVDTAFRLAGNAAVVESGSSPYQYGTRYLSRQVMSLGGGTTEIARNVIAERVLNFPREYAADRGVPFNQVRRGAAQQS